MREDWNGGGGTAGQECCPGRPGRELYPAGVSPRAGRHVLRCYSPPLPLAGATGEEWLGVEVYSDTSELRILGSSHNGVSLALPLPRELAVQDKQRPGDAGRLTRPWLTGDVPGYTLPYPILAGVLE